jgi:copper chaperone CopZ
MPPKTEKIVLEMPALYADHHVVEVRRILFELAGVIDVYASSSFHIVEVDYDPEVLEASKIREALDQAGYLGDLGIPTETGKPVSGGNGNGHYFRHTAAYEQTQGAISFGQNVSYLGRPLWNCPGMGPIQNMEE